MHTQGLCQHVAMAVAVRAPRPQGGGVPGLGAAVPCCPGNRANLVSDWVCLAKTENTSSVEEGTLSLGLGVGVTVRMPEWVLGL